MQNDNTTPNMHEEERKKATENVYKSLKKGGVNYFPLTVPEHIQLLKQTGFQHVYVFWYSYMQMGIYGVK